MQQGLVVVKLTGHKDRRQTLHLVHFQVFSDSAQVPDVIVRKFANNADVSLEIKILVKYNIKIFSSFWWASLTAKDSDWKHGKVLYPLTFMA